MPIAEYKKLMGYKLPYQELYKTVAYSFPNWEELVATRDKHELESFVTRFDWTLHDFVIEYAKHNVKA